MLATSQLGITICSLLILNVSEPAIHHLLEGPLAWTGMSVEWVSVAAFVITLVLVTYLHVVFGEMVPKNLAFSVPDRAVLLLAPPLVFVSKLFRPIIWLLNEIANLTIRAFGVKPKNEATSAYTFDEVAGIVEQSTREGILADEAGTLANTFEFTSKRVREVAVPVGEIRALPMGCSPHDLQRAVAEYGFSRYVIADDGGPVGYVHIKDLLDIPDEVFEDPLEQSRIRSLTSVYEGSELEDALATLRRTGRHLARVVSKTGENTGVLFLEDVIEVLVGEVHDATARR
jgi:CBS domain containing-hemolysin-like protein